MASGKPMFQCSIVRLGVCTRAPSCAAGKPHPKPAIATTRCFDIFPALPGGILVWDDLIPSGYPSASKESQPS